MEITWEEKEPGFWLGKSNDESICKISEHWTGCWLDWLDGSNIPTICGSVGEAKKEAEKLFNQVNQGVSVKICECRHAEKDPAYCDNCGFKVTEPLN